MDSGEKEAREGRKWGRDQRAVQCRGRPMPINQKRSDRAQQRQMRTWGREKVCKREKLLKGLQITKTNCQESASDVAKHGHGGQWHQPRGDYGTNLAGIKGGLGKGISREYLSPTINSIHWGWVERGGVPNRLRTGEGSL